MNNTPCGCGKCDCDSCNNKCKNPCGCAEPVFSVEAMPNDPATLRFNVNGKSVWYDFEPVVRAGETCTTLSIDTLSRTLNYHGECNDSILSDCGEGCEGISDGWVSTSPIDVGGTSLDYILGSDADGKMMSLMPPTDTTTFSYLAWAAQNKAKWVKPTVVSTPPVDGDGKVWRLYVDPNSYEIVIVKGNA